jgi:hypothetical protein
LSAAVSLQLDPAELALLRAAERRGRERYAAQPPVEPAPVALAEAPQRSNAEVLEALFGVEFARRMAERDRRHAEHRAACTATYCDACERYACTTCRTARVDGYGLACVGCQLAELVAATIPRRYRDAIDHVRSRVSSAKAIDLAGQSIEARAIVFAGPSGAGKTTLAVATATAWARWHFRAGRTPRGLTFVSAIDLARARAQHRLGAGEAELIVDAMTARLLVVDDLGAEAARDADVIATVLHRRHDDDAATWITTGLAAEEIGQRYGGGLERRIYEGAVVIDCGAPTP